MSASITFSEPIDEDSLWVAMNQFKFKSGQSYYTVNDILPGGANQFEFIFSGILPPTVDSLVYQRTGNPVLNFEHTKQLPDFNQPVP